MEICIEFQGLDFHVKMDAKRANMSFQVWRDWKLGSMTKRLIYRPLLARIAHRRVASCLNRWREATMKARRLRWYDFST